MEQANYEEIERTKIEAQKQAEQSKLMILKHREVMKERKAREDEAKKEAARKAYEEKVRLQELERLRKLKEVERLEQEELRLIEALQKTQLHQKAAYSQLENALNTSKTVFLEKARSVAQVSPTQISGSASRATLSRCVVFGFCLLFVRVVFLQFRFCHLQIGFPSTG
jgi:hypothetical protein